MVNNRLSLWNAGAETAAEGFARDQAMMTLVASTGSALGRLWRRSREALCLGRFHRRPAGGPAGLERRLSGGRAVVVGPDVACMTLVVPGVDWLAADQAPLRPDQVLNRALRPMLAALRAAGLDAFYGGRDLVTVAGRPLAHAAFTVAADGVCVIEQQVALAAGFSDLPALLAKHDPEGVSVVDAYCFEDAATVCALRDGFRPDSWEELFAEHIGRTWTLDETRTGLDDWCAGVDLVAADPCAHEAFLAERGPVAPEDRSAVARTMLGAAEASARVAGGRCHGLVISGDIIAPFHTLDEISVGLEDKRPDAAVVRRVMTSVMSMPRNFILGATELDLLITRLA